MPHRSWAGEVWRLSWNGNLIECSNTVRCLSWTATWEAHCCVLSTTHEAEMRIDVQKREYREVSSHVATAVPAREQLVSAVAYSTAEVFKGARPTTPLLNNALRIWGRVAMKAHTPCMLLESDP